MPDRPKIMSEEEARVLGRVTQFLYILNRDHLPSGVIEKIFLDHIGEKTVKYSCPHNEALARLRAKRLMGWID